MTFPNIEDHRTYPDLPLFIDGMHSIYSIDFLLNQITFQARNVFLKNSPSWQLFWKNYDWTFHHIVTREDKVTNDRKLDLPRAERIRFPRHYIDNESRLLVWNKRKGNEDKYYIADSNFEYLIILAKRQTSQNFILISAFPTDGNYYRKKLKKEYQQVTGVSLP